LKTLRSYVCGRWHEAGSDFTPDFTPLIDPSTEEVIAQASSAGVDFGAVLDCARREGGPALRALAFRDRAQLLKDMAKVLRDNRDELLELSRRNSGTTTPDGSFDVDGASGTLAYYAAFGKTLGDRTFLVEGDAIALSRSDAFWGRHLLVPRQGVAVHVNAFNFPAWGFAEKAACALLAGMPVVTKPATATALVTERAVELIVDAGILPAGALQLIIGATGDLLDRLGPQDVFAFTGSADTALSLRGRKNLLAASTRVNVEADSLNAAVLGPDVAGGSATLALFLKDVVREITQKTGQKCTAVRRILVPAAQADAVSAALAERLGQVVTGNPADPAVTMGPLATAQQLQDAVRGVAELRRAARLLAGTGERADGTGSPAGKGFFFPPVLLRSDDPRAAAAVHEREVFGPVATVLAYDGRPEEAAEIVALGGGTLVTSVYSDDAAWAGAFFTGAASTTGRIYWGSEAAAPEAPGSGIVLPQVLHGGPGRAGGGEEVGGIVGVRPYLQRVAVQGSKPLLEELAGVAPPPAQG
jgi:3,4-dehydroadipyl-CoA semialdehyde dehydrogenase